jgi:hypothetical protein
MAGLEGFEQKMLVSFFSAKRKKKFIRVALTAFN